MICLTFDIEEFDCPLLYSQTLSFEQQMSISKIGSIVILDLLQKKGVVATFFCTANFALHAPEIIQRIVNEGHEVASHGYYHAKFENKHLKESKDVLEQITGKTIIGFRMPNMRPIDSSALQEAGYQYNSSLNPTYLPGNYNHLDKPRRIFYENGLYQIPASVSVGLRIPLFWLALHNLPMNMYKFLCKQTIKKDGYLNLYLHPWEFTELSDPSIKLPFYIKRNSGKKLVDRLESLIDYFESKNLSFDTLSSCVSVYARK